MTKCGEGVVKVYPHSFLTSALDDVSSGYFSQASSWRCQLNTRLIEPQSGSGGFEDEMKSLNHFRKSKRDFLDVKAVA